MSTIHMLLVYGHALSFFVHFPMEHFFFFFASNMHVRVPFILDFYISCEEMPSV